MKKTLSHQFRPNMNQQYKNIYKKEDYIELAQILSNFLGHKNSIVNKIAVLKEYRYIRKLLRGNFKYDVELKEHVMSLPTPYILTWLIEVMLCFCFVLGQVLNFYVFKIYLDITLKFRGGEFDAMDFLYLFFLIYIYIYMFDKRHKAESNLNYDLTEILKVVRRRGGL